MWNWSGIQHWNINSQLKAVEWGNLYNQYNNFVLLHFHSLAFAFMLCRKWSCWVILLWNKLQGWIQLRAWVAHQTFKKLPLQRNPGSWGRHLGSLSNSQEELGLDAIQNTTTWGDSWLAREGKRCLKLTAEANRIHEQTLVMSLLFILQGSVSLNSLPVTSFMRRRDVYIFFKEWESFVISFKNVVIGIQISLSHAQQTVFILLFMEIKQPWQNREIGFSSLLHLI